MWDVRVQRASLTRAWISAFEDIILVLHENGTRRKSKVEELSLISFLWAVRCHAKGCNYYLSLTIKRYEVLKLFLCFIGIWRLKFYSASALSMSNPEMDIFLVLLHFTIFTSIRNVICFVRYQVFTDYADGYQTLDNFLAFPLLLYIFHRDSKRVVAAWSRQLVKVKYLKEVRSLVP